MIFDEYSEDIRKTMLDIEANRIVKPRYSIQLCEDLLKRNELANDVAMKGYVNFNMGYCTYELNEIRKATAYIMEGLSQLIETEQWRLVARSQNILGIIANSQGNLLLAMDYYLRGRTICEEHGFVDILYLFNTNIGSIYMFLDDVEHAKPYFDDSERIFSEYPHITIFDKTTTYINQTTCAVHGKKYEDAEYYLALAREYLSEREDPLDQILISSLEAQLANGMKDEVRRDFLIAEIDQISCEKIALLDVFDDLYYYAQMLLDIEHFDSFWNFINKLEPLVNKSESYHLQKRMVQLKLFYYEKVKDHAGFLQESGLYYKLSEKLERDQQLILRDNLIVKFNLEEAKKKRFEMEKRNEELQRKSEIDALTGLNNRYSLNEYSEIALQRAIIRGSSLGYEILDIDYFKEYNDNYGHQAGDDILIKIAGVLQSIAENPGVFVARYGGDEFILIYENYTYVEVKRFLSEIKKRIHNLAIPHKFSKNPEYRYVSVSQGAVCRQPGPNNKTWDYMAAADRLLYKAKSNGKNGYQISDQFE